MEKSKEYNKIVDDFEDFFLEKKALKFYLNKIQRLLIRFFLKYNKLIIKQSDGVGITTAIYLLCLFQTLTKNNYKIVMLCPDVAYDMLLILDKFKIEHKFIYVGNTIIFENGSTIEFCYDEKNLKGEKYNLCIIDSAIARGHTLYNKYNFDCFDSLIITFDKNNTNATNIHDIWGKANEIPNTTQYFAFNAHYSYLDESEFYKFE